ncbi:hypothetical protein N0S44_000444 [Escherichia coli]|nr:hypothetical protein [Escherichia coli]EJR1979289.1 hypothetical protein [Escherichia coli]UTS53760.1 hypothetical protein UES1_393 [Escherichia phage UE-S1]
MNKELAYKGIEKLKFVEKELIESVETMVEDYVFDFKKTLIGCKVKCWDHTIREWFSAIILDVKVSRTGIGNLVNGECFVYTEYNNGTRHLSKGWHNLEDVEFIE